MQREEPRNPVDPRVNEEVLIARSPRCRYDYVRKNFYSRPIKDTVQKVHSSLISSRMSARGQTKIAYIS